jgi:hypothetical protein
MKEWCARLRWAFQKFDRFCLLRWPTVWETQAHFVVPVGIPVLLLLWLADVFLYPVSRQNIPALSLHFVLAGSASLFGISIWFGLTVNRPRFPGVVSRVTGGSRMVASLVLVTVIAALPWVHSWGLEIRLQSVAAKKEVARDLLRRELATYALLSFQYSEGVLPYEYYYNVEAWDKKRETPYGFVSRATLEFADEPPHHSWPTVAKLLASYDSKYANDSTNPLYNALKDMALNHEEDVIKLYQETLQVELKTTPEHNSVLV